MAIKFLCACGQKLSADDAATGSVLPCPACKRPVTVPAAGGGTNVFVPKADDPTPIKPTPIQRLLDDQKHSKPEQGSPWKDIFLGVLCAVFFIVGIGSVIGNLDRSSYSRSDRFNNENAYGAAANALEEIAAVRPPYRPEGWFIAALICILITSVDDLRWAVVNRP